MRPYLTKWEDENPLVMDSWLGSINPQLHSLRTISSNQGLIGLYKLGVFSKEELILGHIVLVTLKESPLFRNKLNYTQLQVDVGAKVEPPTA